MPENESLSSFDFAILECIYCGNPGFTYTDIDFTVKIENNADVIVSWDKIKLFPGVIASLMFENKSLNTYVLRKEYVSFSDTELMERNKYYRAVATSSYNLTIKRIAFLLLNSDDRISLPIARYIKIFHKDMHNEIKEFIEILKPSLF